MMEGGSFQSSDGEDGIADGDKAVVGIVRQTGVREHAEGRHVGKLDKAIRGSLFRINRLWKKFIYFYTIGGDDETNLVGPSCDDIACRKSNIGLPLPFHRLSSIADKFFVCLWRHEYHP